MIDDIIFLEPMDNEVKNLDKEFEMLVALYHSLRSLNTSIDTTEKVSI